MDQYMGGPCPARNKAAPQRQEHSPDAARWCGSWSRNGGEPMADDREKISTGPNEEPINETIAGTGPGIPDDTLAPGEDIDELLAMPSDEEVERIAEKLGAQTPEKDTLPLEGE
jgi:hypothetical protein